VLEAREPCRRAGREGHRGTGTGTGAGRCTRGRGRGRARRGQGARGGAARRARPPGRASRQGGASRRARPRDAAGAPGARAGRPRREEEGEGEGKREGERERGRGEGSSPRGSNSGDHRLRDLGHHGERERCERERLLCGRNQMREKDQGRGARAWGGHERQGRAG
jgi:hypothetical protein